MSHYEKRLEADLGKIRDSLSSIAGQVENALQEAMHALLHGEDQKAYAIMLGDRPINRAVRRLDKMCHSFIALHLPSAGHLRFISAVMRVCIALERIGDYAVTICRQSVQLPRPPHGPLANEIGLMADLSRKMLNKANMAFLGSRVDTAMTTMHLTNQAGPTFDSVFEKLVKEEGDWTKKELFGMLVVCNMLLRISDQAKNICEETIFAVTGEISASDVYSILFIDEDNSFFSQMAEALARKTFPNCGTYSSAGRVAAKALAPAMKEFMVARGIDMEGAKPKAIEDLPRKLNEYYVIVSLQSPVKSYMTSVPFHSIALEWNLGDPPAANVDKSRLEAIYREIAHNVNELIEKLRGIKAPCSVS
jgi:phosphate transport system protein